MGENPSGPFDLQTFSVLSLHLTCAIEIFVSVSLFTEPSASPAGAHLAAKIFGLAAASTEDY